MARDERRTRRARNARALAAAGNSALNPSLHELPLVTAVGANAVGTFPTATGLTFPADVTSLNNRAIFTAAQLAALEGFYGENFGADNRGRLDAFKRFLSEDE